jgi:hypothetical protein
MIEQRQVSHSESVARLIRHQRSARTDPRLRYRHWAATRSASIPGKRSSAGSKHRARKSDRAIDLLNRNTAMMVTADGFAPREVYVSTNDANINYCVSTFRSQEHWAAYFKLLNCPKLIFDGSEKRTCSCAAL